jgi:hypothetical protein
MISAGLMSGMSCSQIARKRAAFAGVAGAERSIRIVTKLTKDAKLHKERVPIPDLTKRFGTVTHQSEI